MILDVYVYMIVDDDTEYFSGFGQNIRAAEFWDCITVVCCEV